jgi:PTH1 family peptidyl-tRNA hydrolase
LKFLIAGLGNIGPEYQNTRHNAGFMVVDSLADSAGIKFEDKRFAFVGKYQMKGRSLVLIKPSTFVNLSGIAVLHWLKKEKIPDENLLVVVDDIALPFGILRLRPGGGDGGHNGLINISQVLGTQKYARLRFGIGNGYSRGRQVNYVLGPWTAEEEQSLSERLTIACDIIKSFALTGIERTMNLYNKR